MLIEKLYFTIKFLVESLNPGIDHSLLQLFSLNTSFKKRDWHFESLDHSLEKGIGTLKLLIQVAKKGLWCFKVSKKGL